MAIEFIKINGEHPLLNYQKLEASFHNVFGRTCHDAKIFIFNRFPIQVTPEVDLDYLLVIALPKGDGNFIQFKKGEQKPKRKIYLHNLVVPVLHSNLYTESEISKEGEDLLVDGECLDISKEMTSLQYGLSTYLSNRCGFDGTVYVHPLYYIKNQNTLVGESFICRSEFDFHAVYRWLNESKKTILTSYQKWKKSDGYEGVAKDLSRVAEQAAKDSTTGYLTKQKLDKISKELDRSPGWTEDLGEKMILIKGKAGSGKTTSLLSLLFKGFRKDYNALFLTYNHVLVNDIAHLLIKKRVSDNIKKEAGVMTLHKFFHGLSLSLGVLHVMTEERIVDLLDILRSRMRVIYDKLLPQFTFGQHNNVEELKTTFQNDKSLDKGTRLEAIDFLNFIKYNKLFSIEQLNAISKEYFVRKEKRLAETVASDIFLTDYYEVLENTLALITDSDSFYDKFQINEKVDLLDLASGAIKEKYLNDDRKFTKREFKKFTNRRKGGRIRKRIVYVDEGQDFHRLEKEILLTIFGSEKLVVASGGKEQLIRHLELCNWEMSSGQNIPTSQTNKRNKSYRVKPKIAELCNAIGDEFGIDMNLQSLDTEDSGEVIISFGDNPFENELNVIQTLKEKGRVNGCTPYESILFLVNTVEKSEISNDIQESIRITDFDNIEVQQTRSRGSWSKLQDFETADYQFFDATVADKRGRGVPVPGLFRLLFYESCRGVESWSVACFELDRFFDDKHDEEAAEKYLVDEEKGKNVQSMFITNERRREMYAATWVLMALTRAIDTVYIQVKDPDSRLGKVLMNYSKSNPDNLRVINSGQHQQ